MKIITYNDSKGTDQSWEAYVKDDHDHRMAVGYGATEAEAKQDLKNQVLEELSEWQQALNLLTEQP